ncbi:MAG TPA: response regulator transcription factor [Ignavibacteriaceae bacterium]|jgi:heavy metal response regulator|nr:MAG: Transcriptional activator protein CzcR [Ignavibacteria bacterium ADurb.Bin266]OQY71815.1 MAG: DNA-binding response regulator [Ignavibacteriales bacterium UTCHB2]HQF41290.1 response regulator transcription factor [Ignavibacteriaceae bacterium]HQI41428.1 response regulator transcription factor [Ignavibacteriaceae bacterium]HQJ46132.1 response regulator transcription factor [Ignavibacteriaceae bacterium]
MKILVVEDEKKVASFIKKGLEEEYYSVDAAFDGKEGLKLALNEEYDLIILDLMLPYKDGISILKEIRNEKIFTPVLILTARDTVQDKVKGLDTGADDYLSKPFSFEELLARIRALLRRNSLEKNNYLQAGDLKLDIENHKIFRNDVEIILTPKEFAVLEYLLRNKNRVISRTKLSEHIYEFHFDPETNVIDVFINKLRNKVDKGFEKQIIQTVRGVGYLIKDD